MNFNDINKIMKIQTGILVTKHAIDRYIERIESCSEYESRNRIVSGLRNASHQIFKTNHGELVAINFDLQTVFIFVRQGKNVVVKTVYRQSEWSAKVVRHEQAIVEASKPEPVPHNTNATAHTEQLSAVITKQRAKISLLSSEVQRLTAELARYRKEEKKANKANSSSTDTCRQDCGCGIQSSNK